MNTQSPAIVRGSDQRTLMIRSSVSAAALSAARRFCAVVAPIGAWAFAVQLYLLSYDVGRVSGSGAVGSRSAVGSGAARFTPDDRRGIDAGGVGMSVDDLSISKRINAQRMASSTACCSNPLVLASESCAQFNQRMGATSAPVQCTNLCHLLVVYAQHLSTRLAARPACLLVSYMPLAIAQLLTLKLLSPRCKQLTVSNSHLRT